MDEPPILSRPLPSLAEWIGDGARADGFEQWVRETLFADSRAVTDREAAIERLIKILAVATIEGCRIENERHGLSQVETVILLARAAGIAVMAPVLCLVEDDVRGLPKLVKLLTDEFLFGARQLALAHRRHAAAGAPP